MKKIAVLALALVLAGCAGTGNESLRSESEATVSTKIAEGKTTKQEIRARFGSPQKTEFTDAGLEVWRYEFAKMHADGVNFIPVVNWFGSSQSGEKKELVVLFDSSNVVKRYSMSVSDVTVKTGIFNQ
ncbi:hypothetical protein P0D88_18560 [Paraburkholderia sp. RL18-103-BIB-C]|uniref:hypothetical protein n=1 Tax=unclassified Paraburkholderia TaxID=2615204 RepID=UPI002F54DE47